MPGSSTGTIVLSAFTVPFLGLVAVTSSASAADTTGVSGVAFSKLHAVSASPATDAWAVGFRTVPGGPTLGLTRHWDGTQWTTVPSVHPSESSFLWGVADLSPTDAWAVREWIGQATIQPYAEHWDGQSWSIVHAQPGQGGSGSIESVSMGSASAGLAVGEATIGDRTRWYNVQWDGDTWSR